MGNAEWLCENCYNDLEGGEHEICTISNFGQIPCIFCGVLAEHLTVIDTFKCDMCGGIFEKSTPEDEALSQLKEYFGDVSVDDCDIVCDQCWEVVKPRKLEDKLTKPFQDMAAGMADDFILESFKLPGHTIETKK